MRGTKWTTNCSTFPVDIMLIILLICCSWTLNEGSSQGRKPGGGPKNLDRLYGSGPFQSFYSRCPILTETKR